jgi:hypothetical protein
MTCSCSPSYHPLPGVKPEVPDFDPNIRFLPGRAFPRSSLIRRLF